jgi:DNA-binding PadR family transcriptional regulator
MRHHHEHRAHLEARLRGFGWGGPMGGWGPGWGGRRGGPGGPGGRGRGNRRNVRSAVLVLLAERSMHGYEIITELETRTSGIWRPSPGSVYPTLQMLEDEGLITSEEQGGRKRFTLTEGGRTEAQQAGPAPWEQLGDEAVQDLSDLREVAFGTMGALRQVMMNGTEEQRRRAIEVIADTRKKLYAILAE